ncbi:MAG: hypothetical protein ISS56_01140 [Anaerolineae bacterium]|nr:hypothetical protein [Anaerolineae bacterium]
MSRTGQGQAQKSPVLQLADPRYRFSVVLLDDFLSANGREENSGTAFLLQTPLLYPDLVIGAVAGDPDLGYYPYLHATFLLDAKRIVDLRARSQ